MIRMKTPRIGHDHEIEIGPPLLKPAPKFVKQPARMEMIENEIAKFENPDQDRFRSCLYPSLARSASSSLWICGSSTAIPPPRCAREPGPGFPEMAQKLDPCRAGCKQSREKRSEIRPLPPWKIDSRRSRD